MRKKNFVLLALILALIWTAAFSRGTLSNVLSASASLTSFKGVIEVKSSTSKMPILFNFEFVPPNKMRINYIYPMIMKGTIIMIDGKDFYTYIPSLHLKKHSKIRGNTKNPGESMGFFFHFVQRDLPSFLKGYEIINVKGTEKIEMSFEKLKASYETKKPLSEAKIQRKRFTTMRRQIFR